MLKQDVAAKPLGGFLVQVLDNPAVMLMARDAGLDFAFFDGEHGTLDYRTMHDLMLLGNQIGLPSLVRVAQLARADVSRALDMGASGVMVPMMETAEQAKRLVEWSKYPPLGRRSYSGGGNTAYAPSGNHEHHMTRSNNGVLSIAQIETVDGVANIDEILSVDGIDAAIVGPCDLGISLGNPDDVNTTDELRLIGEVAIACHARNKAFGIIGGTAMLERFSASLDLYISAIDTHILRAAFKDAAQFYNHLRNTRSDS